MVIEVRVPIALTKLSKGTHNPQPRLCRRGDFGAILSRCRGHNIAPTRPTKRVETQAYGYGDCFHGL